VWSSAQVVNVPTSYGQAPDTPVRFTFKPSTAGYSWSSGKRIRIKIASNLKGAFAAEPVPAKHKVLNGASEKSKITLNFAA
jgi:hypothetical protein